MSQATLVSLIFSLMMSGCFTESLPDPTCFNQSSLSIPQEIAETNEPALIFQYLSKQANHCVNANDESLGLEECRNFYRQKLGYLNSGDFTSIELIRFIPINDQYGRCELRCEENSCECLFDYDCGRDEMNEPLSCQWLDSFDESSESVCNADLGCTVCR